MLRAGMSSTDSMSPASQSGLTVAHRRERDSAIAEHDRSDAVPARRGRVRIPCDLRVEVGVHVDEARRDVRAAGVDLAPAAVFDRADCDDPIAVDRDIGTHGRVPGAVDDRAAPDHHVVGHAQLVTQNRQRPGNTSSGARPSGTPADGASTRRDDWKRPSGKRGRRRRRASARTTTSPTRDWRRRSSSRSGCSGPLLARRRGRCREDGSREGPRALDRRRTAPAAVLRGHRRGPGGVRVGLLAPAPAPARGRGERRRGDRGRAVLRTLPREAAAVARASTARRRPAAGPAGRRGRPRRRRVRSVPPRDPLGLVDLGARARRDPGRGAADRGAHVEPHSRRARRAEAALPLPLDRASRLRT